MIDKIIHNSEKKGIELYFKKKPLNKDTKNKLLMHHFKWHRQKKCWYVKATSETLNIIEIMENNDNKGMNLFDNIN